MRNQKNTVIIIGSVLVLIFISIRYVIGFNGLYGQDSYDYLRFTNALSIYFKTGNDPGSFFWPVNYPVLGAVLSFFIPSKVLALQLISYLGLVVSFILIFKIIETMYQIPGKILLVYLSLSFILSPYMLRASVVVMSDMLALVFSLATFLSIINYLKTDYRPYFLMALAFSLLAGFTRHHTFVIMILPMVYAVYIIVKRKDYTLMLFSIFISIFAVFPTIWLKGNEFSAFTDHQWFLDWSPQNWFKNKFTTSDGQANYLFPNIIYGFYYMVHPGFIFPGIVLIIFVRKIDFKNPIAQLIIAMVILNGLFIGGIPFQNLRFHILIYPFVLILLSPAIVRLDSKISTKHILKPVLLIFVVLIQITLFVYLFEKFYSSNKLEKLIAATISDYPGNPVYTFAIDQAIKTYTPEKDVKNIWYNKYENFDKGSLFLFNEKKFKKQWEGKNPWINWQNANRNYTLETLEILPEGWVLYEIR